jgi:hypothetical protein
VERLRERDEPERAEARRQLLRAEVDEAPVRWPVPRGLAHHVGVGIDADGLREERCEEQRQRPRSAADVEQPAGAVEPELVP